MLGLTNSILGGAPQQAAFTPFDIGNGGDTNQSVGPEIWLQVYNDIHSDENSNGTVSHTHNSIANNLDDQDRINEILEKISKSGYDSLNQEEKEFLFKQGN